MTKLLQSRWAAVLVGVVAYVVTTLLLWHPAQAHPVEKNAKPRSKQPAPSWAFHNPEVDQLIAELKKEKESVAQREKQLNDLAARLQTERQEINQITQSVHELQIEFDRNIVRVEEHESANLKKLAKVYSTMAPESAVQILKQMDEVTMVKILSMMKDSETAPIFEVMGKQGESEAKRAADVSERLRLAMGKSTNGPASSR